MRFGRAYRAQRQTNLHILFFCGNHADKYIVFPEPGDGNHITLSIQEFHAALPQRKPLPEAVIEQVEIGIKYEGYIKKQLAQVEQMHRLEEKKIPEDIDYKAIHGLRLEAAEKLDRIRPMNIGQAGRISGVSPADVSVLLIYLQK